MHKDEIYDLILKKISTENVLKDEEMKKHTSFKIGGCADFFVKAKNIEEVNYIVNICKENKIKLTVIGNGSNILVTDKGIRGIVLKIDIDNIEYEDISGIELNKNIDISEYVVNNYNLSNYNEISNKKFCIIKVGAGVKLGFLAQNVAKKSLSGFEFASGIPGSIGGAVRMNAGAYGKEFSNIVLETLCMDLDGNVFIISNNEHEFEYRSSVFKTKKYIVLETKILLEYVENNTCIYDKMNEYKKSRNEKQPIEYPSAGSTFKRGENFITSKIIDECGLKGYRVGDAQVSVKHAGFVVNLGDATADDVIKLTKIIQERVYEKYKYNINLEIEIIGE